MNYFDTAPGYGDGLAEATDYWKERRFSSPPRWPAGRLRQSLEASCVGCGATASTCCNCTVHRRAGRGRRGAAEGRMLTSCAEAGGSGTVHSEDNNAAVFRFMKPGSCDAAATTSSTSIRMTDAFGTDRRRRGMATVTMRTASRGRCTLGAHESRQFDYTMALIQFVLFNPLVDVALVGMRDVAEVDANVRLWRDVGGRIDVAATACAVRASASAVDGIGPPPHPPTASRRAARWP